MRHVERLELERTEPPAVAGNERGVSRLVEQPVLGELRFDQRHRERGCVDRQVALPKQERQRADVILVAVRHQHTEEAITESAQIGEVWDHQVDSRGVEAGKHHAAIDRQRRFHPVRTSTMELDHHQVQPDLAETSERHEAEPAGRGWLRDAHDDRDPCAGETVPPRMSPMIESRTPCSKRSFSLSGITAVSIGSPIRTSTSPLSTRRLFFGITCEVPTNATGAIGVPVSMAKTKPPFLKGSSSSPSPRVPSGKTTTEMPRRMRWPATA